MRVVIAGPPKSGNARLRCLLSTAFGLRNGNARDAPTVEVPEELLSWLGRIPEQSVVNAAVPYSDDVVAFAKTAGIDLVAIIRHPFDLFVSSADVAHQRAVRASARRRTDAPPDVQRTERPALDDAGLLDFARDGFAVEVATLAGWADSGVPVVRYEDLEADAAATLAALAPTLGPISSEQIARAVSICPAEGVILGRAERGNRMPALPAGSWRERLPAATRALLKEKYSGTARRLGYEID